MNCNRFVNAAQLAVAILFAIVGAIAGAFLAPEERAFGALAGGFAGLVAGTFVSGFALMFLPLFQVRDPLAARASDAMTGHEYLQRQLRARSWVHNVLAIQGIVYLVAFFATQRTEILYLVVAIGSIALLPVATFVLHQRCPSCHGALSTSRWQIYFGENCPHCGKSFSEVSSDSAQAT